MTTTVSNSDKGSKTRIDFTNLQQYLNMEELEEHVENVKEETHSDNIVASIDIPMRDAFFLFELTAVLRDKLNIVVTSSWVNSRILNSFYANESFISIFNLTKSVRFCVNELLRLRGLGVNETRILKNMLIACSDKPDIRYKVGLIKMELKQNDDAIFDIDGKSSLIDDTLVFINKEFNRLFPTARLEKGLRGVITKGVLISLVYRDKKF